MQIWKIQKCKIYLSYCKTYLSNWKPCFPQTPPYEQRILYRLRAQTPQQNPGLPPAPLLALYRGHHCGGVHYTNVCKGLCPGRRYPRTPSCAAKNTLGRPPPHVHRQGQTGRRNAGATAGAVLHDGLYRRGRLCPGDALCRFWGVQRGAPRRGGIKGSGRFPGAALHAHDPTAVLPQPQTLPLMENTIKVQRAIHNFTQEELAQRIGVSRQTINSIEANRYVPSTVLALKLSEVFGIPVNAFFSLTANDR